MNTIDRIRIYKKIIESPPDMQGINVLGNSCNGYTKEYLHKLIMSVPLEEKKVELKEIEE